MPSTINPLDQVLIKQRFIEELRMAVTPAKAARAAGVSRSQAYQWREEDAVFNKAWVEAVAEGVDKLEDEAVRRAHDGYNERPVFNKAGDVVAKVRDYSDNLLSLLLKVRRSEVFNRPVESVSSRVNVRVSLKEATERLERLGLPIPQIEGDYRQIEDHRSKK